MEGKRQLIPALECVMKARNRGGWVCIDGEHDEAAQLRRAFGLFRKSDSITGGFRRLPPFELQIVLASEFRGEFLDGKICAREKRMKRAQLIKMVSCPARPCVFVEAFQ